MADISSFGADLVRLAAKFEKDKTHCEIAVADEKIDEIVYKLYGVTEEERKIIEGG